MALMHVLINEPNLHGYQVTVGNRRAQYVRCYEGMWLVFCYIDNTMQRNSDSKYLTKSTARNLAVQFVKGA